MDPVFYGYADPAVYGGQSYSSFDPDLNPLEDEKGSQTQWGLGASYKWDDPRLKLDVGYITNEFKRDSSLTVEQGGSQNYVKLKTDNIHLGLNWEAADDWTIRAGCDWVTLNGHWDPSGAFNQFAAASKSIDFKNIDMIQTIPFVGFDWDMSANTLWSLDFRYYDTKDKIDSATYANFCSQGAQSNACATQMGYTIHPFSWYGWQVSTAIKMRF